MGKGELRTTNGAQDDKRRQSFMPVLLYSSDFIALTLTENQGQTAFDPSP